MRSVYLAGPITGVSYDGSTDWRAYAVRALADAGIEGISPMRAKDYLKGAAAVQDAYAEHPLSAAPGFTARDRFDTRRADMVLFNFTDAAKPSLFSCVEVGWADAWRKPIVVVMSEGNPHWHAGLRQLAGFVVPTLDEALLICRAVLC